MIPLWNMYRMLEQRGESMAMTYVLGAFLLVVIVEIVALALYDKASRK